MTSFPHPPEVAASASRHSPWAARWMAIVWPAFLLAAALEMVVFALVDPGDLHWFGQPVILAREAVYTLAFFLFWGVTIASSALTTLLSLTPVEVNRGGATQTKPSIDDASAGGS